MRFGLRSRRAWMVCLMVIIAIGILSRTVQTGFVLFDKYLGDALYAAMVYALLRVLWSRVSVIVPAAIVMIAIELFQLTGIPARMVASGHLALYFVGRLLGTHFSFVDLLAYGVGIAGVYFVDARRDGSL